MASNKVIILTTNGKLCTLSNNEQFFEDSTNGQINDDSDLTVTYSVRLDKAKASSRTDNVHHVVSGGPFNGVVINKTATDGLALVRKANVRMEFNVYMKNSNNENAKCRRETRELLFWFNKKTNLEEQKSYATQYFKLLIEPETFPRDYAGYIKKAILLLRRFRHMIRVQLNLNLEPEPKPETLVIEEEEELIQNFITVLTPAVYDYQYLPEVAVGKKNHVTFRVRAAADAHIALSMAYGDTNRKTYEITLGSAGNTLSTIRYGGQGTTMAQIKTPNLLDAEDFKSFWISWDTEVLQVGHGSSPGKDRFMRWLIPKDKLHSINCMSVSTGPGSDGQWEFVEYIAPTNEKSETTAAKRAKLRRGILWHAKKMKMLQTLEEAFPSSLNMTDLLRRSLVSLSDMLEAVIFLKDLQDKGLVIELSRGVWLRSPKTGVSEKTSKEAGLQIVPEFPALTTRDAPTVVIFTTSFCEKMAVDAVTEASTTYVRHNPDAPVNGEMTQSYTVGRMGEFRIVSTKIPLLYINTEATAWHGTFVSNFIDMFDRAQHVIVIGSGGAVPNFGDFERHVRLGDIAVSVPPVPGGSLYLHCQDITHGNDGERYYGTRVWDARRDGGADAAVRKLVDFYCGGMTSVSSASSARASLVSRRDAADKRPWERIVDDVLKRFEAELDEATAMSFHRPPAKTDRLYAVIDPGSEPVLVKHPVPAAGREHLMREGLPNVRCGTIASGRLVTKNAAWRLEVADGLVAYDRGLHEIIDALESSSRLNGYLLVLGISDYVDGCKGRTWQPYSALCAAAFTKTLISTITAQTRRGSYYS